LHPRVQSFDVVAVDDFVAREFGGLLEKRNVGTQPAHVFVDLEEHFIVFEKCLPLAVRVDTQWVVPFGDVTVAFLRPWHHHHLLYELFVQSSLLC
jgi:hypothetical protein